MGDSFRGNSGGPEVLRLAAHRSDDGDCDGGCADRAELTGTSQKQRWAAAADFEQFQRGSPNKEVWHAATSTFRRKVARTMVVS